MISSCQTVTLSITPAICNAMLTIYVCNTIYIQKTAKMYICHVTLTHRKCNLSGNVENSRGAISEYPTIYLHISERFRKRYIETKGI